MRNNSIRITRPRQRWANDKCDGHDDESTPFMDQNVPICFWLHQRNGTRSTYNVLVSTVPPTLPIRGTSTDITMRLNLGRGNGFPNIHPFNSNTW